MRPSRPLLARRGSGGGDREPGRSRPRPRGEARRLRGRVRPRVFDPAGETVTVLKLAGNAYVEHGLFAPGDMATSALLDGVAVDVTSLFDEAESGQPQP